MTRKLVLVTSLYDLTKRGSKQHRTVDWMLEHGAFVLGLPHELVIFTEPELADTLRASRKGLPTTIVTPPLEALVDSERTAAIFRGRIQHNATRAKVTPAYVQLMWAKYGMLSWALEDEDTTHVGWIDFAITHVAKAPPEGVDIFAEPPELPRVHVLRYFDADDVSAPGYLDNVQGHLAGGLVVGGVQGMRRLCYEFWQAADRASARGQSPLDEGLLSEVVARDPKVYSYSYGDYCDILTNHDVIRGGREHLIWQINDAAKRGGHAAKHAQLVMDAMSSARPTSPAVLGLVMIVKNEAHGIRPTLESFKPFIDHWTILDTGSTDGTQDLIRETLAGIPGRLHEEPFVDFATSRNRALELHGAATTFTIMPDSDDHLVQGEQLRAFVEAQARDDGQAAYLANLNRGDLSYWLPIVLRAAGGWRYHGVVHEFVGPTSGSGFATVKIPGPRIVQDRPPQQSKTASRARWTRDLELLTAAVIARPRDPRTLFYLAQTYECLSQPEEALTVYARRIAVGGWHEETFEAHLRSAKILQTLARPWPEVQQAYLEAHRVDPTRAEPLFKIAEYWYGKQAHPLAYLFGLRASELPRPSATLFVDEEVYTWKAADLVAISGYYLNDPAAKGNGRRYAEKCVRAKPGDERMRANWAFYAPSAAEMFKGYRSKPIGFVPEPPYVANNPSIHFERSDLGPTQAGGPHHAIHSWRCVVRTTNYKIVNGQYLTPDDNVIYTRNFMLDLDDQLDVVKATEMIDKTGIPRSAYPVHGFEDCRLFRHQGKLVCTSTVCDFDLSRPQEGPREIVLAELDADYAIVAATPLRGPWSGLSQKNWMPASGGDDDQAATLIYAASPDGGRQATVFGLDGAAADHRGATFFGHGRLRGGSQAVRVPEGWLCIVHDVSWPGGNARIYLHRFVLLSADFKIVSMTDPFYFERKGIEFCAGLAYDGKQQLVASFGVEDRVAYFGVFDLASVVAKLRTDYQI
jgi:hypothetical protein